MAKFAYNNTKNTSIGNMLFEFNYEYHPFISYKKDIDCRSKSKATEKLSAKL